MKQQILLTIIISSILGAINPLFAISTEQKKRDRISLDEQIKDINKQVKILLEINDEKKFTDNFLAFTKEQTKDKRLRELVSTGVAQQSILPAKDISEAYEKILINFLETNYGSYAKDGIENIKKINTLAQNTISLKEIIDNKNQEKIAAIFDTAPEISQIIQKLSKEIISISSKFSTTSYKKRYALELAFSYAVAVFNILEKKVDFLKNNKRFSPGITEPVNTAAKKINDIATKERQKLGIPTDAEVEAALRETFGKIKPEESEYEML